MRRNSILREELFPSAVTSLSQRLALFTRVERGVREFQSVHCLPGLAYSRLPILHSWPRTLTTTRRTDSSIDMVFPNFATEEFRKRTSYAP